MSELEIPINEIQFDRSNVVGNGACSIVYSGKWTKHMVALKELKVESEKYSTSVFKSFYKEVEIMKRLKHPNIVQLYGICTANIPKPIIVLEFLHRGSLFKVLHQDKLKLPKHRQLKVAIDMAYGINYLHNISPKIIHRDLRSHKYFILSFSN